jgi:type VI secretion system secreted protein Hcp
MKKSHSMIKRAAWLLLPLFMSLPYTAQASIPMFLEFSSESGIRGEAQNKYYQDQIDVLEFSEGMSSTASNDYRGAGKPTKNALAVTKYLDRSSPALRKALVEGRMLEEVTLRVIKQSTKNPYAYFVIKLKNVYVTKVSMDGSGGDDRLIEKVELTFAKVIWTYTPQKANGDQDTDVIEGWDFETNQEHR